MRELGAWSEVVVGTKVRLQAHDLEHPARAVRASVEASLERLSRNDVDILHLHNPIALTESESGRIGLDVALTEIAGALQDAITAGLARHAGFTGLGDSEALLELLKAEPFATVQTYFNALNPSAGFSGHDGGQQDFEGLIDAAARAGCGVIVIRALAAGAAAAVSERAANAGSPDSGLVQGGTYAADLRRAERLKSLAAALGLESPVELSLRFALGKPGVSTVLVGLSNLAQLEDALRFTARGALTDSAIQEVLALSSE
jgi:aryl-alcohol dehydrogenase-like predicted oxidoreductase